jgi:DNA mismatch repair enzyme (predicted ATPase)
MLLDLIENNPYEKADIQIPKIKNILASKACRSSVMVGKALSSNHMIKIIHNLATLKSPWNCPHG